MSPQRPDRRAVLVFAATILVSAFLLFQVQPLIGKIILPWFGGSAAVWSATLLFFQVFLLGGYAYAHTLIRRVRARTQMLVHAGLLVVSCALLPILPDASWKPTTAADPTLRILTLLAVSVGLPYFLLSSTSPLLQAWYVRRTGSRVPYRLFALSNFGSMLGLLSFPFLVEPNFTSRQQGWGWSGLYVGFVVLGVLAAWSGRREAAPVPAPIEGASSDVQPPISARAEPEATAADMPRSAERSARPGFTELVLWVGLAACGSALLLAVTTHMTQNIAPIPLLWVVPLVLYLATFILAFESDRFYRRWIFLPLLAVALAAMAHLIYAESGNAPVRWVIPVFAVGLFVSCMMCHGELARRRPAPEHLTLFYLMVALGGALGGVFVAIVAPRIFDTHLELPLGLVACAVLATIVLWRVSLPKSGPDPVRVLLVTAVAVLAGYLGRGHLESTRSQPLMARNFYGALAVQETAPATDRPGLRSLIHGTINHGDELQRPGSGRIPTSYYGIHSGIARGIRALDGRRSRRIGVLGLGAGVSASLTREGDALHFYEINPLVQEIAERDFSFLRSSPADTEVLLGDGRLVLERLPSEQLDFLAMDAFTSDAVPIHLLTREAFSIYERHVRRDGLIAINVTNRYLDLEPVVAAAADDLGWYGVKVADYPQEAYYEPSVWILLARSPDAFAGEEFEDVAERLRTRPGFLGWTDNYSNIFRILR